MEERLLQLRRILDALQSDPNTPWWTIELIHQLVGVIVDLDDLGENWDALDTAVVFQGQELEKLKTRYSEVLYKLKTGD